MRSIVGMLLLGLSTFVKAAPALKDAWVDGDAEYLLQKIAQPARLTGIAGSQRFDPRDSKECKAVEFPVFARGAWYDTNPKVAYLEGYSADRIAGPSPDGKLWVCDDSSSNRTSLFGPPKAFDRLEELSPKAQKLFTSEGWNDDVVLLKRYPWPEVKRILSRTKRDCYRAAARIAKARDRELHPGEYAMEDDPYDSRVNTAYARNGFEEKRMARFEGGNVVHLIQVIHERFGIHKYDDYEVTLDAASCGLVTIVPGKEVIVGWRHDGRRRARLEDFIGDTTRIPTAGAAERAGRTRTIPLPAVDGPGSKALRQGSEPARKLVALFGEARVRAAFVEIDKVQVLKDTDRDGYLKLLDQRFGTLGQFISSTCSEFQDQKHRERLIEADKDDSEPNLDVTLSQQCSKSMFQIYTD